MRAHEKIPAKGGKVNQVRCRENTQMAQTKLTRKEPRAKSETYGSQGKHQKK